MSPDRSDKRRHPRLPVRLKVAYRTAGSFLVSYTINLSRGGLFIQTDSPLPEGTPLTLELSLPGRSTPVLLNGHVAWSRRAMEDSPGGMGIAFQGLESKVGALIDHLAGAFQGLKILYMGSKNPTHAASAKRLASILHCDVRFTESGDQAIETLKRLSFDLLVVDMDSKGLEGLALLRTIREKSLSVPVVALATSDTMADRARAEGADEVTAPSVSGADLKAKVLSALARPVTEQ